MKMSAGGNLVCAVVCILVSFQLQGCDKETIDAWIDHGKNATANLYNAAVDSVCKALVHDKLDELILLGIKGLEETCKADDVLDDSMCEGWGIEKMAVVEDSKKDEWMAGCVKNVNDAVAHAQGNYLAVADFVKTWWAENGDALGASIKNFTSDAYETASGAAAQGVESSVIYLCRKTVEGSISHLMTEAQKELATKCKDGATATGSDATLEECELNGLKALDAVAVSQTEKQSGECVKKVQEGLDWVINKLSEFKNKLTEWWQANEKAITGDTWGMLKGVFEEAATKGTVTVSQRLYDSRDGRGMFGLMGNSVLFAAAATSALLAVFIGAFVLRMRRSARTTSVYEATQVAEDRDIELE